MPSSTTATVARHNGTRMRREPTAPSPQVHDDTSSSRARRRGVARDRSVSPERLAEESGLPRYISDVERGRRNVGMGNIDRLARALSVDLPTLMAGVEEQRSR
jgi:transcriptional regulator with XRE-family HTH domain